VTADAGAAAPERVARLASMFQDLGCALLHDAAPGRAKVVDPAIRCRTPGLKAAGPVFPVATANDMLPCLQALDLAPPGWVIFINNTTDRSDALAGDIFVTACRQRRLGGLIVRGAVRDVAALREMGFPVYSSEVTYVSAKTAKVPAAEVPETLDLGSYTLAPGDWIFADDDGVLALPERYAGAVMRAAVLLGQAEDQLKAKLRGGETLGDLCGLDDFLAGRAPLRFEV
jgi:4-hydroxy-4-methyl-2-oxoglutarate aldolase